ncbi:MAG: hypothetical protein AAGH64_05185 [Planctomycetota bacterium]
MTLPSRYKALAIALSVTAPAHAQSFFINGASHGFVSDTGFVQSPGVASILDEGFMWTADTTAATGSDPALFDDLYDSTFFAPTNGSARPSATNAPGTAILDPLWNIPFANAPADEVGFGWIGFIRGAFAQSAPGFVGLATGEFIWLGQLVVTPGSTVDVPRGRTEDSNQFLVGGPGDNPLLGPAEEYTYFQSEISFTDDGSYDIQIAPDGEPDLWFSVLRDGSTSLGDDRYTIYLSDTRVINPTLVVRTSTVPAPGGALLAGMGVCVLARRRR